jgi:phosphohistidine phosphatase SixA
MSDRKAVRGMEVYIHRHAEADFNTKDQDPPVSEKGKREAARVVKLAAERFGFRPTVMVKSWPGSSWD